MKRLLTKNKEFIQGLLSGYFIKHSINLLFNNK